MITGPVTRASCRAAPREELYELVLTELGRACGDDGGARGTSRIWPPIAGDPREIDAAREELIILTNFGSACLLGNAQARDAALRCGRALTVAAREEREASRPESSSRFAGGAIAAVELARRYAPLERVHVRVPATTISIREIWSYDAGDGLG